MKKIQLRYIISFLSIVMGGKVQAQDWPNLNKYQKQNVQLKPLQSGENRIVFMGDSITEFWSVINPEYFAGKPYVNRGISGQTTPQMLVRFRADVIALKPAVVVILAGINDIAGNTGPATLDMIANNIFSMAELAKANHIKVILCSVLPAYDFSWKPNQNPADKVVALNEMIQNYAEANEILYLDYFSAMADERKGLPALYSNDEVHPNKTGYQVMAPLAEKAIIEVLAKK
ncbi:SGNH/GDSL hydrolase family protein [Flavobacterium glaciei]|uniref:Lysophospholipase L1-like esterase n=1 Tax=Flavobacterium glaciei TaxID=386300 RepID=A0A562PP40_9FLAO|nr:SGNH/GDSL hydrolase family protein [Flavobacterium glaciei]RDI52483.1 lysophospholipase L1-like esterase [Flavobacterium glaciei]TWI46231.1 lysophospholipase L1-like esterase [Flavobacterium glaciei]